MKQWIRKPGTGFDKYLYECPFCHVSFSQELDICSWCRHKVAPCDKPEEKKNHPEIVLCKDCQHRGVMRDGGHSGFDIEWPTDEDGYRDYTCPFCCSDPFYSGIPEDDFYCKSGLRKGENK